MAKSKVAFVCDQCGADYPKWQGQCNGCGEWNTLKQFSLGSARKTARSTGFSGQLQAVQKLAEVEAAESERIATPFQELDRVLGGGMVPEIGRAHV